LPALKRRLRAAGITYTDVAHALGVSLPTVKRLMGGKTLSLARLEALCRLVNSPVSELVREAEHASPEDSHELTRAQEAVLMSDLSLYSCFLLLLHGLSLDRVRRRLGLSRERTRAYLAKLDQCGLIELAGNLRFRVVVPRTVRWRRDGKVAERIARPLVSSLSSHFLLHGEQTDLVVLKLAPQAIAEYRRRMREMVREMVRRGIDEGGNVEAHTTAFFFVLEPVDRALLARLRTER
jgi:hypothetical protein